MPSQASCQEPPCGFCGAESGTLAAVCPSGGKWQVPLLGLLTSQLAHPSTAVCSGMTAPAVCLQRSLDGFSAYADTQGTTITRRRKRRRMDGWMAPRAVCTPPPRHATPRQLTITLLPFFLLRSIHNLGLEKNPRSPPFQKRNAPTAAGAKLGALPESNRLSSLPAHINSGRPLNATHWCAALNTLLLP